ncbi:MAG: tripartite tricarboxylate transporter substrate binding protein [Pseudomonadota bacterium]|nr:tripartite tricarboxylate transporter substrate binding protein [Pseudomonadota bacterium]
MRSKNALRVCMVAALGLAASGALQAQEDYPTKAIEIIVPASAGGGTDLGARTFAKYAQKKFGQPVVVVNVPGAGGYTGSKTVHEAKPDGHKVLYFHANLITNFLTNTAPYSYDGFKVGPTLIQDGSMALFTKGDSGIKTINDLIAKAKENPGKLKAATEYGAFTYFMLLKLQQQQGVKFNLVDVGTDAQKITALLGGYVDIMPRIYAGTQSYIDAGDFNVLCVLQEEQVQNAPNVPTCKEQGVDFTYPAYPYSFFFPKDTPQEVFDKFVQVVQEVSQDPAFKADIEKIGLAPKYISPEEAAQNFADIQEQFTEIAKEKAEVSK